MAEQNEIKKVITVDLGNATTSLRDYKKHIDDLRGSLLQLDDTSEEYNEIAKEIKKEQDKLNEVMKVGKTTTDAAEGSYNQLTQTMAELKKQWKATADVAERDELGKQILDINNQLKELDASTGNFQRNVGDYANAFETAFGKCLDGITQLDGPVGELGGNLKNMLPVIKSINNTALTGLSGIKKGIAATGIGVLVIAVSELITHWEDLVKLVGVSTTDISNFKTKSLDTLGSIVAGSVGVGNAIGNFLLTPLRATIEAFKGLGNIIKDVFTGNFDKVKEDATATFDAINSIAKKGIDFKGNYETGVEIGNNMINGISEAFNSTDAEETIEESSKNIGKTVAKGINNGVDETEETAKIDSAAQTIIDRLHKRYTDEIDLLTEKYETEKALLIQNGLETTDLTKEFEENKQAIIQKRLDEEKKAKDKAAAEDEKRRQDDLKKEQDAIKAKKAAQNTIISNAASIFGTLADMSEENSESQKAFAIMETIINTLQSIMGTWAGYSELGPWGIAAAAVQTAAITATGAATVAKIKATTKNSASTASVAVPNVDTPSMTQVSPLLDEQSDLNRLTSLNEQGNSAKEQQTIKCYVVESEITDLQNKVNVVEDNATF